MKILFSQIVILTAVMFTSGCEEAVQTIASNKEEDHKPRPNEHPKTEAIKFNCPDISTEESKTKHIKTRLSPYLEGVAHVLLPDCRMLKIGGMNTSHSNGTDAYATVQAHNRIQNTWDELAPLPVGLAFATATVMHSGDVFVVGGIFGFNKDDEKVYSKAAYIYQVKHNNWVQAPSAQHSHIRHQTIVLRDGRILVIGSGIIGHTIKDHNAYSEIYNPQTGQWLKSSWLPKSFSLNAAYLMDDDNVIVTLHENERIKPYYYNAKTNTWTNMQLSLYQGVSTKMPDGSIMLVSPLESYLENNRKGLNIYRLNPENLVWTKIAKIYTKDHISYLDHSILVAKDNENLFYWGRYGDNWLKGLAIDLKNEAVQEFGSMQSGINIWPTPVQPVMLTNGEIMITPNHITEIIPLKM